MTATPSTLLRVGRGRHPFDVELFTGLDRDQRYSFLAALLAWSMDTFDYFMIVLVMSNIAADPHFPATLTELGFLTTATLVMRPFGALLFGLWADRVGRRVPLIVDVLLYSCTGILCAIAPNITVLLILRGIYGLGMGGEWGLGAALAMEKLPREKRGLFSGLLQEGYPLGYLMATLAYLVITVLGVSWRWIFVLSIIPALTTLLLRRQVSESKAWEDTRKTMSANRTTIRDILRNRAVLRRFGYLIVLMTALNWMAHSAQDVYPTFLKSSAHDGGAGLSPTTASWIIVGYTLGAIAGSTVFGALSEKLGRRNTIMLAAGLGLPILPLFVLPRNGVAVLIVGSVLMMIVVQGAWGVVPAHLTEMSPDEIRGFYPGVTYQIGNLFAALNVPIQEALAAGHGYPFALACTVGPTLVAVVVVTWLGREERGVVFGAQPSLAIAHAGAADLRGRPADDRRADLDQRPGRRDAEDRVADRLAPAAAKVGAEPGDHDPCPDDPLTPRPPRAVERGQLLGEVASGLDRRRDHAPHAHAVLERARRALA
jgi:SHS family lactate transporter-like MFS transporter